MKRVFGVVTFALVVGCNAILGNEKGVLDPGLDAGPTPIDAGTPTCPTATPKLCFGSCVSLNDPTFGCASGDCTACSLPNVQLHVCSSGTCGIMEPAATSGCKPGYDNCDGKPANGCEADLSRAAHCGICNRRCTTPTPFCVPQGATFQCAATCLPPTTQCGSECVDTASDAENCNACGNACHAPPANGSAECANGKCGISCATGYHQCGATNGGAGPSGPDVGATCENNFDPGHCGASCVTCPAVLNAKPACAKGQCTFVCDACWADCNANPADGCETNICIAKSCGACNVACETGSTCCPPRFVAGTPSCSQGPCPL